MKSLYFLLATALIAAVSATAQTVSPPSGPAIPPDEAGQHLIERALPAYPPIAKVANVEGDVKLTLEVDQSGGVVRVVTSSGPVLLRRAAETAAEHYHYRPFEMNGKPVDVLVEAVVNFRLHVSTPPVPFPEVRDIKSVRFEYTDGSIDIRVSGDGRIEYDGQGTGVAEGKHKRQIKDEEVQLLLDAFRNANFFSLNDDYSVVPQTLAAKQPQSKSVTNASPLRTITFKSQRLWKRFRKRSSSIRIQINGPRETVRRFRVW